MIAENETIAEETKPQPGDILKSRRESLGLTQKQIADRLRLRLSIIENIEENQFETDQVATFTRGYLKSYARAVGVDESEVLAAMDVCDTPPQPEQTMQSFSQKTNRDRSDSRIMTLTWGILAVVVGISTLWWWQNQQNTKMELSTPDEEVIQPLSDTAPVATDFVNLEGDVATTSEPELTEESQGETSLEPSTDLDATPAVTPELEQPESEVQLEETSLVPEVVSEASSEPTLASESKASTEQGENTPVDLASLLEMHFDADCWIQIKDASGKTLSTGLKKAGQTLQFNGEAPYKIVLGAPEGVSITFASEPVDLSGYTSGKVARFTLP